MDDMDGLDSEAKTFFDETAQLRPSSLAAVRSSLATFVQAVCARSQKIALVTSGGTSVPLEAKTVRSIENFSTGTRGARCTEELLAAGYAVVFLYRSGSMFPYLSIVQGEIKSSPLAIIQKLSAGALPSNKKPPRNLSELLLPVPFETIFDYLFLLRETSTAVRAAGADAIIFLAAAVSDFYIPEREMVVDKIQSRAHDGLTITLRNVPKLLGAVRHWAPQAFLMSFKLETNANILLAKAAGAIQKYSVDAVCSNVLESIRDVVTIVWKDPGGKPIEIGCQNIRGDEKEPVPVSGLLSRRVERGTSQSIDAPLIIAVLELHESRLLEGEPVAKKAKFDRP